MYMQLDPPRVPILHYSYIPYITIKSPLLHGKTHIEIARQHCQFRKKFPRSREIEAKVGMKNYSFAAVPPTVTISLYSNDVRNSAYSSPVTWVSKYLAARRYLFPAGAAPASFSVVSRRSCKLYSLVTRLPSAVKTPCLAHCQSFFALDWSRNEGEERANLRARYFCGSSVLHEIVEGYAPNGTKPSLHVSKPNFNVLTNTLLGNGAGHVHV